MDNEKKWYASKTLWFNTLTMLGALFGAGGQLGHVLAPEEVAAGIGFGNIILRLFTDKGVVR